MMAFVDQYQLAKDSDFKKRVQQALVKSCIAVMAEDGATANHANRIAWANKVLNDPERPAQVVAFGVVTNTEIDAESSDSDIEYTVNTMFDAYAGK